MVVYGEMLFDRFFYKSVRSLHLTPQRRLKPLDFHKSHKDFICYFMKAFREGLGASLFE